MTVAPQLTVMLMLEKRFTPLTCVVDVCSLLVGVIGVGGRCAVVVSSPCSVLFVSVVLSVGSWPLSTVDMRFAIRTLSICAMEMMFPWPRICVAALMMISGVSSSEVSWGLESTASCSKGS